MLILLVLVQIASQPITFREPHSPARLETRLSGACGEASFELRWTVLRGHDSRFDEVSANGNPLPLADIESLNRWKGERLIEGVRVTCEPNGRRIRTRLLVQFGRSERLGLPKFQSFEIVGNRLVFEPRPANNH